MATESMLVIVVGSLIVLGIFAWYLLAAPSSQILCPTISSGHRNSRAIALTFDDGPGPETLRILEVLRRHEIRATFFLCGNNIEKYPQIAAQIATDGHCIGNHAYSHEHFLLKSPVWMRDQVERTDKLLRLKANSELPEEHETSIKLFRPPYGLRWFGLASVLKSLGFTAVMWDVNAEDWKSEPAAIVEKVVSRTKPGSIILLHDGLPPQENGDRGNTVLALPQIIKELSERFDFQTVQELLGQTR